MSTGAGPRGLRRYFSRYPGWGCRSPKRPYVPAFSGGIYALLKL